MSSQTRRRLHSGAWREVMRRFEAGNATVGEFCARESISVSSFYRWRSLVGTAFGQAVVADNAPSTRGTPRQAVAIAAAPAFIDLGTMASSTDDTAKGGVDGPLELRLELGGGLVLHLSRH